MFGLLNWRLWAGAIFLALLPILYMKGRADGRKIERADYLAATRQADHEARKTEELRRSRVVEAQRTAAVREAAIRADAASAARAVGGLRDALRAAERRGAESAAAANQRAAALGELLVQGAEAHRELAERCDRHVNDVRTLLDAWPK
jgi:hypothetical protein